MSRLCVCVCLLPSIWPAFSPPALDCLLVVHARNLVLETFSSIVYPSITNPVFVLSHTNVALGKKILLHFHYFSKHFEILLHFMNVCREGDGIHIKVHVDSWYMNLTLHQSVRRPWLCCAVASGDSGIFTFVPLFPIFSLRMYTILDSHITEMLNNIWM